MLLRCRAAGGPACRTLPSNTALNKAPARGLLLKRFVTGLMFSPSSLEPPERLGSSNYLNVPVGWEKTLLLLTGYSGSLMGMVL